jgi:hypothetical protein
MLGKRLLSPIATMAMMTFAIAAHGRAHIVAPDHVKTGLRILNQVVGHTGRLIAAKRYDAVPTEHHEIVEGAEVLREALAKEPEDFRAKVDALLDQVVSASSALEPPSKTHDGAKLAMAHTALADTVHEILDIFSAELQPMPRY